HGDYPRAGGGCKHLRRRLDTVHPRHLDVHEHDVGLELGCEVHGRNAVGGLSDDLHVVGSADEDVERFAHERLVVGDEHPDRHASILGLNWGSTESRSTKSTFAGATSPYFPAKLVAQERPAKHLES